MRRGKELNKRTYQGALIVMETAATRKQQTVVNRGDEKTTTGRSPSASKGTKNRKKKKSTRVRKANPAETGGAEEKKPRGTGAR